MRLLHCIPSLGFGGAERQLVHLANELSSRGLDVHVALVSDGPLLADLASAPIVHRLKSSSSYDPRVAARIASLIRTLRPDIVQSWLTQMDVLAGTAARWRGVPWILTERSSAGAYPPALKNRLRRSCGRRAAAIVANSEGGLAYWRAQRPRTTLLRRIPNAVFVAPGNAPLPFETDERPLVAYVGRFSEEKNLLTLVDALARTLPRRNAMAVLCGGGPMDVAVREKVSAAGIADRVLLPGQISDVGGVLRRADVFVSISNFEGLPNAVIEAAACRTPLVLSDIDAHRELFDDAAAVYVERNDVASVAAGIERVLDDRDAAHHRIATAEAIVGRWSPAAIASQYIALYEELLQRTP